MHSFDSLINLGTSFTLKALDELNAESIETLQTSARTSEVKKLQMIQLQKVVMAIGMFSLFESILQQRLSCKNGFDKAKEILKTAKKHALLNRFKIFYLAINVLKHGKGQSYNELMKQADSLPFQIKKRNHDFFNEGNIDEVSTFIEVDNQFVLSCADIVEQVSKELRKNHEIHSL